MDDTRPTEFDERHATLRDEVRDFVRQRCDQTRCMAWDRAGTYPKEVFDAIAAHGWYGLGTPESGGGAGGSDSDLLVVAEELGRGSTDLVACFSLTASGLRTIASRGTAKQKAELLPALMAGTRRLSVSVTEPASGSDAASLSTLARREGDVFVVNGQKTFCEAAALPDTLIQVYVRTDPEADKRQHGISMLLVDPVTPGVTLRRLPTMGRNITGVYDVVLEDARIPAENLVGTLNHGWVELGSQLPLERLIIGAGFVGATMQVLEDTLAYVKERHQFGRPIGSFQGVGHVLVDLFTRAESIQLLIRHGGALADAGLPYVKEASMAKTAAAELYADAARAGIELHGSYGYLEKNPLSMHYADSVIATVAGGAAQIQRNIVAGQLGLRLH